MEALFLAEKATAFFAPGARADAFGRVLAGLCYTPSANEPIFRLALGTRSGRAMITSLADVTWKTMAVTPQMRRAPKRVAQRCAPPHLLKDLGSVLLAYIRTATPALLAGSKESDQRAPVTPLGDACSPGRARRNGQMRAAGRLFLRGHTRQV